MQRAINRGTEQWNAGRFKNFHCRKPRLRDRNFHYQTRYALRQLFRQQTGMTISQYLRQLRLCQAQYLLRHSSLLISEIAARCGFEDSNYFSVVFTRETGVTPRVWRQQWGALAG
ncbi:helix-turn-helix domain-containing protein [Staphylococcus aureus]|nr:helix-turn-helix domain-containing protein [Staphylococcus aureus]